MINTGCAWALGYARKDPFDCTHAWWHPGLFCLSCKEYYEMEDKEKPSEEVIAYLHERMCRKWNQSWARDKP